MLMNVYINMTTLQGISKLQPESWAYYELEQHKLGYGKEC
jgi:hypothetical protein